nr:MarR family transcriptional regulator [Acinetobacter sp. Marseille-Q1620]
MSISKPHFRTSILRCARLISDEINHLLEPFQLNYSLWQVLFVIHSKQNCTFLDIAEYLNVSKPSITKRIQALNQLGLLTQLETQDKRQKKLCLSEHGMQIYQICSSLIDEFEQLLISELKPDQISQSQLTTELVIQKLLLMKTGVK